MFAYTFILILVLPVTFLSSAVESLFSADELKEMGIRLGNQQAEEIL
jgi:hypothetical protein